MSKKATEEAYRAKAAYLLVLRHRFPLQCFIYQHNLFANVTRMNSLGLRV
jgi:hypothetical protein